MELDILTRRINQLAPMARINDREDEAKVRFLTKAVIRTPWGLAALQRTHNDPPYQRFINDPYTSIRELGTYKEETQQTSKDTNICFCKSLWREKEKGNSLEDKPATNDVFLTEFFEAFFAGQRRWGRNPGDIDQKGRFQSMNQNRTNHEARKK